ncbi:hypothetical protein, partial [Pseudomonas fulva]|uniref:hypothetical protein n=1 Tax=Pseudomonas fulva TaxID=47880 RepID=UPI0019D06FA1
LQGSPFLRRRDRQGDTCLSVNPALTQLPFTPAEREAGGNCGLFGSFNFRCPSLNRPANARSEPHPIAAWNMYP